jgi:hypothetical protein
MQIFRFALPTLLLFTAAHNAGAADCDRDCLRGFVTSYLNAMVARNPSALPLGDKFRFTEDGVDMKLGDGLWKGASRITDYRQDILDVRQGVAASLVIVEEAGTPELLSLRLKVVNNKLTEAETMVTRTKEEGRLFALDALKKPRAAMAFVPDKSQLASREEAIRIAELYPAGLKIGSFVTTKTPFATDAYRLENGVTTAGVGCARGGCENMQAQKIMEHPAIKESVAAVDEQLGIVLLRMNFGDTGSYGPGNSLHVFEAFKVYGGQIHAVEAFMKVMPANKPSGWD